MVYLVQAHAQYHGIWWKDCENRYTIQVSNRFENAKNGDFKKCPFNLLILKLTHKFCHGFELLHSFVS